MPLPQKPWFRVAEIAERWGLTAGDIEDYALDEQLELSVLMVGVAVEEGVPLPSGDGGKPTMSEGQIMLNGPQRLLRVSLLEIVRNGQAEIHRFGPAQPGGFLSMTSRPGLTINYPKNGERRQPRESFTSATPARTSRSRIHSHLVPRPKSRSGI